MNKWTALHWAAKRNNPEIVKILVENGAEKLVENDKGKIALQLTTSDEVRALLGGRVEEKTRENVIRSETASTSDNDVTAVRDRQNDISCSAYLEIVKPRHSLSRFYRIRLMPIYRRLKFSESSTLSGHSNNR